MDDDWAAGDVPTDGIDWEWLDATHREIKIENGIDPERNCLVCLSCRKPVRENSEGELECEC